MKFDYINKKIIVLIITALSGACLITIIYYLTQQANINYYKGHRLFLAGEYEKAIPYYKNALEIDPVKTKALKEIAYSYMWTKRPGQAGKYFKEALKADPDEYKLKRSLAKTLSWQKKYNEAIVLYKEIVSDKDDIQSKKDLAKVYIWAGRFQKAKETLQQVLQQYPRDSEARLLWGKLLLYSGEDKEAAKVFEELLKEETSADSK